MAIQSSEDLNPFKDAVSNLSQGISNMYHPLLDVQKQLKELTTKQNMLVTQIHKENLLLAEVQYSSEIQEMFTKLNTYHGKLVKIRKEMKYLHERGVKLKKRALKLQQVKERENSTIGQNELDLRKEEELIGMASSSNMNS